MNYKDEIERLEMELKQKRQVQQDLEKNCKHDWGKTKSDPEEYRDAVFSHFEPHGSDPEPIYDYVTKFKPRWSRTCKSCGKTEYTYEQAPTAYEPKFN